MHGEVEEEGLHTGMCMFSTACLYGTAIAKTMTGSHIIATAR